MLRLLLLEDSKLDAQIIEAELAQQGLSCALERVESRERFQQALAARDFDVILSDFRIPGFGGEQALTLARELAPDTPFIFVSGALGEHTAVEQLKRGATDYVLKEHLERLGPSVQRALRERREKDERQRAERMLREREQTLSTLMSNLPGMAFRRDRARPWRVRFASTGCRALIGVEPEQLIEQGWDSFVHPDDLAGFERDTAANQGSDSQLTLTYRIRTARGEVRWVWERSALSKDDAVEGFATDITKQKLAEAEVSRRVEFEQQLIGIVSHDLRNPLNAISLGAASLLKQEGLDLAGTRSVRRILSAAERAARMIRDLLDFTQARLGGGIPISPRPQDLLQLLEPLHEEFQHAHPEREIVLACPASITVECDPDRVMQALANLISNALAYSPAESVVTLRALGERDAVCFEVHNHGDPIPPERIPELFEPLSRGGQRVNLQTRSIGLGLFIVRSIASAHGGSVSVRSSGDEGTTFSMRIPIVPREVPLRVGP